MLLLHNLHSAEVKSPCSTVTNRAFTLAAVNGKATPITRALAWARDAGMDQQRFADRLGVSAQAVTNWKARGMPPDKFADVARLFGRTIDELVHGEASQSPTYPYMRGRSDQNHSGVFHSEILPELREEDLVRASVEGLPAVFSTRLADGALAPDYPAGMEIVWSTRRRVEPGRLLLVRDRYGQVHARQCRQGKAPGQWLAAPFDPAYVTFERTEVEVLAVFKGRLEPDDT